MILTTRIESSSVHVHRQREYVVCGILGRIPHSQTLLANIARKVAKLKFEWAVYCCRIPSELWAKMTT